MKNQSVKISTLILALLLLMGVISMIIGFYNRDPYLIKGGVAFTFIMGLLIISQSIITQSNNKKVINK